MLECGEPESTVTGPSAAAPSAETVTPARSPSHSRAMARPVTVDIVAPVTNAPENSGPSPKSSASQPTVSRSRSCAEESIPLAGFWS
jgi:hypothetical protein